MATERETKYFRLKAIDLSAPSDYPMYLDAPVETTEEGSFILMRSALCGFFGDFREYLNPFVLRKEKSGALTGMNYIMDFGSDFEGRDRQYTTNLPSKKLSKGTQFTVAMYDNNTGSVKEYVYVIRDIIDLLNQQKVDSL